MKETIYLNELSLDGQYNSFEEFFQNILPVMKCFKFAAEKNCRIQKHSMLYKQKITKDKTWNDLRGAEGDMATRLKSLLQDATDSPPFWDYKEEYAQDLASKYYLEQQDVSATSLAEAAEDYGIVISFPNEKYQDKILKIMKNNEETFELPTAVTVKFMVEQLRERQQLSLQEYLIIKYENTRLDFSTLEPEYGFDSFEKDEINECLRSFDRFVSFQSWEEIYQDQGLRYKKYSPSSREHDWFRGSTYKGKEIDKFRCINPKRCFGYREGEIFYVLRMERNHKISDFG